MRNLTTVTGVLLLSLSINHALSQGKSLSGKYTTSGVYAGIVLNLGPDSSFTYNYKANKISDTAAGKYSRNRDTLISKYTYNNSEEVIASYEARNEEVPASVLLAATHGGLRPKKAVKKGKRLYVVDDATGKLKTYKERGKTKQVYMNATR